MARGRSANNVVGMPGAGDEDKNKVNAAHKKLANKLRPRGMRDEEKKVWNSLAPQLVMLGRLKLHFVSAFADYCYLRAKLVELRKELDDDEWFYVIEGRNGKQYKAYPQVAQAHEIWRQIRSWVGEFGLAPGSDKNLNTSQGDLFDNDFGKL